MIETLSVSLSGPAFSFLLYENSKSKFSQEGFLIGQLDEKETKKITDNEQQQVHISRTIQVSCAVPCPRPFYFYDEIGRIDEEKIRNLLGDLTSKVVAWYKYKSACGITFTFREKIVHKQLAKLFSLPPEFFSCCLLISEHSDNDATHTYTQTFMREHNERYEKLPLHIVNLSDPNNTYKSQEKVSETFMNIINELEIDTDKTQGINIIMKIQNALQKHTSLVVENLAEAEERVFQLEKEVKDLMEAAKERDIVSASSNNKENQLNNKMDTDSGSSPVNSHTKLKERGKTSSLNKGKRNANVSPKKVNPVTREIVTRSRKKV